MSACPKTSHKPAESCSAMNVNTRAGFALFIVLLVCEFSLSEAQDRLQPIPADKKINAAHKEIESILGRDLHATNTLQLNAVVDSLLKLANESDVKKEAARKYALLMTAYQTAIRAGNASLALDLESRLSKCFEVDKTRLRLKLLQSLKVARVPLIGLDLLFVDTQTQITDQSTLDQYETAEELLDNSRILAKKSGNTFWYNKFRQTKRKLSKEKRAFRSIMKEASILKIKPKDPNANQLLGEYYCFQKQNWERGLNHLILGSDSRTRRLAQLELAKPSRVEDWLRLANGWWEYSDSANGKIHAKQIYRQVLPKLKGLAKAKVEKKLRLPIGGSNTTFDLETIIGQKGSILWKGQSGKTWQNTIEFRPDGSYQRSTPGGGVIRGNWNAKSSSIEGRSTNRPGVVDIFDFSSQFEFTCKSLTKDKLTSAGNGSFSR